MNILGYAELAEDDDDDYSSDDMDENEDEEITSDETSDEEEDEGTISVFYFAYICAEAKAPSKKNAPKKTAEKRSAVNPAEGQPPTKKQKVEGKAFCTVSKILASCLICYRNAIVLLPMKQHSHNTTQLNTKNKL